MGSIIDAQSVTRKNTIVLDFNIATRWIDLNEYQAKGISKQLVSPPKFKRLYYLALLWFLFVSKRNFRNVYRFYIVLRNIPVRRLKPYLKFIFENPQSYRFPKKIKLKDHYYFGPGEYMKNVRMNEFKKADEYFYHWKKTNDSRYLDALCLVLYRKKSKNILPGDIREVYNEQSLIERGALAKYLQEDFKMAVAMSFLSCKAAFMKKYKNVFPVVDPKKEEAEPTPKKEVKYTHYDKIILAMAMSEHKTLGNVKDIENAFVDDFLRVLDEEIRIDRERAIKEQLKSKKR